MSDFCPGIFIIAFNLWFYFHSWVVKFVLQKLQEQNFPVPHGAFVFAVFFFFGSVKYALNEPCLWCMEAEEHFCLDFLCGSNIQSSSIQSYSGDILLVFFVATITFSDMKPVQEDASRESHRHNIQSSSSRPRADGETAQHTKNVTSLHFCETFHQNCDGKRLFLQHDSRRRLDLKCDKTIKDINSSLQKSRDLISKDLMTTFSAEIFTVASDVLISAEKVQTTPSARGRVD